MLNKTVAAEVLAAALATGGDFAEIFFEDTLNNRLYMHGGKVETALSGRVHGAGVRVLSGVRCIYAYTNDTSRESLLDCARKAAAAVRGEKKAWDIILTPRAVHNIHPIRIPIASASHKERVAVMRQASLAASDVSAEVSQVEVNYMDSCQRVWIANSEGLYTQDERTRTRLFVSAVAANGTENQTGSGSIGEMRGPEMFEQYDPASYGREAAERAVRMLHAPVCPAGVMPVVMAGGFGGVLFHEACGHSLEATSVGRGLSEFCGKLGQKIASDCVTAIDDGTIPNAWGSINIDDEGMPTNKLVLIEKGILKNYMIDKLGGRRMNMEPTGSSRRQSYAFAPTSRMRNTYIDAGDDDDAAILADTPNGLYAAAMGGGSVHPVTGEFNFAVDEGYLIKNGKLDTPVRGASLIGRGSEVLIKIDRVGKTVTSGQGICGSMSGGVPVNCGQPTLRISSLTVGGR